MGTEPEVEEALPEPRCKSAELDYRRSNAEAVEVEDDCPGDLLGLQEQDWWTLLSTPSTSTGS